MTRQYLLAATLALSGCAGEKGTTQSNGASNSATADCDGEAARPAYADADGDGFGDPTDMVLLCGAEEGRVANDGDCNDDDPDQHPDAVEVCDAIDNNCDGVPDDDSATDATDWYTDRDGDGIGSGPPMGFGCTGADGQVTIWGDCDDNDPDINPGAEEQCDGIDNDCNGSIDDGEVIGGLPVYEDSDADGWGNAETEVWTCTVPEGWVMRADDCDDGASSIHPDAVERCDAVDDNCDGHLDNGCATDMSEAGIALAREGVSMFGAVATGDFTGDGIDDVMAFAPMDHRVLVYPGPILEDGSGSSHTIASSSDTLMAGAGMHAQADFDGDGALDLLVPTPLSAPAATLYTSVRLYTETHVDDFDLDDPAAVLTSTEATANAWGVSGIAHGTLTDSTTVSAVLTRGGGEVFLWTNPTEDVVISADTPIARYPDMDTTMMSPAVADIDSDGTADLMVPTGTGFDAFLGPLNPETWPDAEDLTWRPDTGDSESPILGRGLCLADLTGDGHAEMAYSESTGDEGPTDENAVRILPIGLDAPPGDAFLLPSWSMDIQQAHNPMTLKCADLDGDGHADLLVQNYAASLSITLPNNGETAIVFGPITLDTLAAAPDRIIRGTTPNEVRGWTSDFGDVDDDGVGDLVLTALNAPVQIYAIGPWTGSAWAGEGGY